MQDPGQTGDIFTTPSGFSPDEMLVCEKCGKRNPPTRQSCLYCASVLGHPAAAEGLARLDLTPPEPHENGISVILMPGETGDISSAAAVLGRDADELKRVAECGIPMPIARLRTEELAAAVAVHLARFGFRSKLVADDELALRTPPQRIRALEFLDEGLRLYDFNTTSTHEAGLEDIRLVVTGRHDISMATTSEVQKRRKNASEKPEELKEQRHEKMIDIYVSGNDRGFRIRTSGFDFSCLGEAKAMLASENIDLLAERLASLRTGIIFDKQYNHLRHLLDAVWEPEFRREAQGLVRSGLGRLSRQATDVIDNLNQFTKYSRMRNHLL